MKSNQDFEKIKLIIETVNYEINSYTPWVARKEIAAWAAIVFYLALIGAIIGFLFKNLNYDISFIEIILLLIPSAIFIIILSIIFASFIHSQFSSIYDKQALTQALRKNIYWLLKINDFVSIDLGIGDDKSLPNFLYDEYKILVNKQEKILKDSQMKRPIYLLKNLLSFLCFRKNYEIVFGLHGRQEAIIYSFIILSIVVYNIVVLRIVVLYFIHL